MVGTKTTSLQNYLFHHSLSASASLPHLIRIAMVSSSWGASSPHPYCWWGSLYWEAFLLSRRWGGPFSSLSTTVAGMGQTRVNTAAIKPEHSLWLSFGPSFFNLGSLLPIGSFLDSIRHSLGHLICLEWWLPSCSYCSPRTSCILISQLSVLILKKGGFLFYLSSSQLRVCCLC
jgi:hypothetical protein